MKNLKAPLGRAAITGIAVALLASPLWAQPRPRPLPRGGPIFRGPVVVGPILDRPLLTDQLLLPAPQTLAQTPFLAAGAVLQKAPAVDFRTPAYIGDIAVLKRAPVATQRFDVRDPKTGAAIAPTAMLTTPDGRTFKAGEYYDQLNQIEKGFNELGYSLRTMPDDFVLQKTVIDVAQLEQVKNQVQSVGPLLAPEVLQQRFSSTLLLPDGQKVLNAEELTPANVQAINVRNAGKSLVFQNNVLQVLPQTQIRMNPNVGVIRDHRIGGIGPIIAIPMAQPKTFHQDKNWNWYAGNNQFKAEVSGDIDLNGTANPTTDASAAAIGATNSEYSLTANARAGGKVFSRDVSLLNATARFYAPSNQSKSLNASAQIQVAGISVYNLNQNVPSSWQKTDNISRSVRWGVPFYLPLGPILVTGEIGVQGQAGLSYNAWMNRSGVGGGLGPFVNVSVYGEVGVSIGVAGAGVGGQLQFLQAGFNLNGSARLGWNGKWTFAQDLYAGYDLNMMKGRFYVYLYVYVPAFAIPPWEKKQWEHDMFNWGGFKTNGTMINYHHAEVFDQW